MVTDVQAGGRNHKLLMHDLTMPEEGEGRAQMCAMWFAERPNLAIGKAESDTFGWTK